MSPAYLAYSSPNALGSPSCACAMTLGSSRSTSLTISFSASVGSACIPRRDDRSSPIPTLRLGKKLRSRNDYRENSVKFILLATTTALYASVHDLVQSEKI